MTGFQFFDFGKRHIESGHDYRAFGCHNGNLVIAIVETRSYSVFVPKHKSISVSHHTCHDVSSVPLLGRRGQNLFYVQVGCNSFGYFDIWQTLLFVVFEQSLNLSVQKLAYLFQNDCRVCHLDRMLSQRDKFVQHLVDIGEVKVACQNQVASFPVVFSQKGVQVLQFVFAKGAITQVSEEKLARKACVLFQIVDVLRFFGLFLLESSHVLEGFCKNVLNRLGTVALGYVYILFAGLGVKLDVGKTCSVLPSVVLLLHKEIHSVQCPCVTVLFLVIFQRFKQSQHCYTTLMLDLFAHLSLYNIYNVEIVLSVCWSKGYETGICMSNPKVEEVILRLGAACRRFHSFIFTSRRTFSTTSLSNPAAIISDLSFRSSKC